jgi:hypothetical protein
MSTWVSIIFSRQDLNHDTSWIINFLINSTSHKVVEALNCRNYRHRLKYSTNNRLVYSPISLD